VVISIVALLVALILPAFSKAREVARRAKCMSNIRQFCVAAHTYAGDYQNRLPQAEPNPTYPGRYYCEYAADGLRNGWAILFDFKYIQSTEIANCPSSKGFKPQHSALFPAMYARGQYSYRHNFVWFPVNGVQPALPRYLDMLDWNHKAMFTEDADMGLNWGGAYPTQFAIEVDARVVNPAYWPHEEGGNASRQDGSVKFIPNFFTGYVTSGISPDGYPNYYLGWPSAYYWDCWTLVDAKLAL